MRSRALAIVALLVVAGPFVAQVRAEHPAFKAATHGDGELTFVDGVPVIHLRGTPAEVGEQLGVLAVKNAAPVEPVIKDFLKTLNLEKLYPFLLKSARGLKPNFPTDHLTEVEAAAKAGGLDLDVFLFMDCMYDLETQMGCSTLVVETGRSATGQPLFGRNFDWPASKGLADRTAVVVFHQPGKRAFASVAFAPVNGVISGMNDAGLCCTINQVRLSQAKDKSKFDPQGVPTLLAFRRVLEECKTVADAEKLLRSMKRTTTSCLTVCDPTGGAVFEITPKTIEVRTAAAGLTCCTNHFCTDTLNGDKTPCPRLTKLDALKKTDDKFGVDEVFAQLDAVNQGKRTMQSMVFEPATKTLHLKLTDGKESASKAKAVTLDLGKLMAK